MTLTLRNGSYPTKLIDVLRLAHDFDDVEESRRRLIIEIKPCNIDVANGLIQFFSKSCHTELVSCVEAIISFDLKVMHTLALGLAQQQQFSSSSLSMGGRGKEGVERSILTSSKSLLLDEVIEVGETTQLRRPKLLLLAACDNHPPPYDTRIRVEDLHDLKRWMIVKDVESCNEQYHQVRQPRRNGDGNTDDCDCDYLYENSYRWGPSLSSTLVPSLPLPPVIMLDGVYLQFQSEMLTERGGAMMRSCLTSATKRIGDSTMPGAFLIGVWGVVGEYPDTWETFLALLLSISSSFLESDDDGGDKICRNCFDGVAYFNTDLPKTFL